MPAGRQGGGWLALARDECALVTVEEALAGEAGGRGAGAVGAAAPGDLALLLLLLFIPFPLKLAMEVSWEAASAACREAKPHIESPLRFKSLACITFAGDWRSLVECREEKE